MIKKRRQHRETDCSTCQKGQRNFINIWWNQNRYLLEVTAKNLQNRFVRNFCKVQICEICKCTKVTRAACRCNSQIHISRAVKFCDIITADHKVLNGGGESRNKSKGMQLLCKIWPLNGFKVTHAKQQIHKKRREIYKSFSIPKKIQR